MCSPHDRDEMELRLSPETKQFLRQSAHAESFIDTMPITCGKCELKIDPTEQVWGRWSAVSVIHCPHCGVWIEISR